MKNPNLDLIQAAAERLRPLLSEVVFVGGCATGLLITDQAAAPVRGTNDVDVIAEIASYADYVVFSDRLRACGFDEDTSEGAPVYRWRCAGLVLDLMPLDERILGFSNRWYADALRTSREIALTKHLVIRLITAPYFLGTKLEAFRGCGRADYFASRDLEDLIAVVDGRASLASEIEAAPAALRAYVAQAVRELLSNPRFLDALPGYLLPDASSQARVGMLRDRLYAFSALG